MKRMRTLCLTGLLWMMTCILYAQNQLITYTVPSDGVELKDDFTVRVRQSGSGWKEVVTYPMKVDEVRQTKHHVELASMGYFDFSGQVEVSVTYNKGESWNCPDRSRPPAILRNNSLHRRQHHDFQAGPSA